MSDLTAALKAIEGRATPATVIAETVANLTGGKKCPFAGAVKRVRFNVMLNTGYERKVNRQLDKEGKNPDFESQQTWGEHETPCLIEYNGKEYLQVVNPNYLEVEYFLNGVQVPNEDVKPWERKKTSNSQGTDEQVRCSRYGIQNIRQITFNGQTYVRNDE